MSDAASAQRLPICSACQEPVPLETAKTDEDGHAIHENCYWGKIKRNGTPTAGSATQGPSFGSSIHPIAKLQG